VIDLDDVFIPNAIMDARHLMSSMQADRLVTFDNALARNERDDPACPKI
jgi:hypothetical protein